jgi:hypothetical protein
MSAGRSRPTADAPMTSNRLLKSTGIVGLMTLEIGRAHV